MNSTLGRMLRQRSLLMMCAVVVALALAACGGGGGTAQPEPDDPSPGGDQPQPDEGDEDALDSLIAAAREEGGLTWYSAIPESTSQPAAEAFSEAYDIPVELFRASTGPLATRYASERTAASPTADVIGLGDPVFMQDGTARGWFRQLSPDILPNLATWPEDAVTLDTFVKIGIQPTGLGYNTELISDPPTSWEDLLDERFRGEILLVAPDLVPVWQAQYKLWHDELGMEFLEGLAANEPGFVDSANPGAQQVAAGEYGIIVPTNVSGLREMQEAGAPLELLLFEPTTGFEMLMAVSDNAENPNAALLFLNWAMSPEGQQFVNPPGSASLLPDIPGSAELPDGYLPPDNVGAGRMLSELMAPFDR